ncbi:MAG: MraY family glycosyltransferase, partial [Thermodesulfobacteriota bacterium]|nr:MraY family glycosyltransferase [Thermodesulfobacteriota bacterium]
MFASFIPIGLYTSFFLNPKLMWFVIALVIMFITGLIDDIIHIGFKRKLIGLLLAICIVVFIGEIQLKSLGNLLAFGNIRLGVLTIPFTIIAIFGVTNAINLIDGLDGLASGIGIIALSAFTFFAFLGGNYSLVIVSLALIGSLIGFLIYNFYPASIFMGDSGSLFLGFCLSIIAIILTQNSHQVTQPIIPVTILALPIFDTLWVMGKRILCKENPFIADKNHIHHNLLKLGLSHKQTVYLLWGLTGFLSLFAVSFHYFPSYLLFYIILTFCCVFWSLIEYFLWKRGSVEGLKSKKS